MKENGGGGKFKYDIYDNFCKCHNVPPPRTTTITTKRPQR
jgi:hypothetical protein